MSGAVIFTVIIVAVIAMIIAISKFNQHPFLVLTIIAIIVGLVCGIPAEEVIKTVKNGFGSILANIGIVILAGTIIGTILEKTGAALTMAQTISAMVAPLMPALGFTTPLARVLIIMAIGAGSMTVSHANDSYFWVVSQFSDMNTKTAYKCQTGVTAIMGITAIVTVYIASLIFIR